MLINVSQLENTVAMLKAAARRAHIERTGTDYVSNYKETAWSTSASNRVLSIWRAATFFLHRDVESQCAARYDPINPSSRQPRPKSKPPPRDQQAQESAAEAVGIKEEDEDFDEDGPRPKGPQRRGPRFGARPRIKPPIQDILRRGDEVLVQVIKEGIGTKGPTLSTYISIPGRYLVLMPALGRVGVSRKIEDEDATSFAMHELNPPRGLGFIVRTAGVDRTKKEISDLAHLLRL